ncbi:viral sRNA Nonstructural protein [Corfou virus]|uniref:Nonstructural protein n=1 Tax=Corfou virus TaxID=206376 RepID=A7KCK7_9VIRU|nr:viral sRNA Nonstructural protein [Corfou virus]ABQ23529.1 nonstructural protein [Corfou virus]ALS88202.1 viral sRNA Nonstructural protein [Corfou virus]
MNSQYLFDYPVVKLDSRVHRALSTVNYMAFNKFYYCDISTYEHCEFPLEKYSRGFGRRGSLSDFYLYKELPASWGPACTISSVRPMVYPFRGLVNDLSRFDMQSFSVPGLQNIRKAISWPFGFPDLEIFEICNDNYKRGLDTKNQLMSYILRMADSKFLDECMVQAHKKIISECRSLGLQDEHFNGYDLFREISTLVCTRLINAEPHDSTSSGSGLEIKCIIRSYKINDPSSCVGVYGSGYWEPVNGPEEDTYESSDSEF